MDSWWKNETTAIEKVREEIDQTCTKLIRDGRKISLEAMDEEELSKLANVIVNRLDTNCADELDETMVFREMNVEIEKYFRKNTEDPVRTSQIDLVHQQIIDAAEGRREHDPYATAVWKKEPTFGEFVGEMITLAGGDIRDRGLISNIYDVAGEHSAIEEAKRKIMTFLTDKNQFGTSWTSKLAPDTSDKPEKETTLARTPMKAKEINITKGEQISQRLIVLRREKSEEEKKEKDTRHWSYSNTGLIEDIYNLIDVVTEKKDERSRDVVIESILDDISYNKIWKMWGGEKRAIKVAVESLERDLELTDQESDILRTISGLTQPSRLPIYAAAAAAGLIGILSGITITKTSNPETKLRSARERHAKLEGKLTTAETERDNVQTNLKDANSKYTKLETEREQLETERDNAKEELTQKREKYAQSKTQNDEAQKDLRAKERAYKDLEERHGEKKAEVKAAKKEIEKRHKEYTTLSDLYLDLDTECRILKYKLTQRPTTVASTPQTKPNLETVVAKIPTETNTEKKPEVYEKDPKQETQDYSGKMMEGYREALENLERAKMDSLFYRKQLQRNIEETRALIKEETK